MKPKRAGDEPGLDEERRDARCGRAGAVDLLDQHAARRVAAGPRALDQDAGDRRAPRAIAAARRPAAT